MALRSSDVRLHRSSATGCQGRPSREQTRPVARASANESNDVRLHWNYAREEQQQPHGAAARKARTGMVALLASSQRRRPRASRRGKRDSRSPPASIAAQARTASAPPHHRCASNRDHDDVVANRPRSKPTRVGLAHARRNRTAGITLCQRGSERHVRRDRGSCAPRLWSDVRISLRPGELA